MNKVIRFSLVIFVTVLSILIFNAVANFFNIGFQYYGVYMFFGIGLLFLYYILPNKTVNIFE